MTTCKWKQNPPGRCKLRWRCDRASWKCSSLNETNCAHAKTSWPHDFINIQRQEEKREKNKRIRAGILVTSEISHVSTCHTNTHGVSGGVETEPKLQSPEWTLCINHQPKAPQLLLLVLLHKKLDAEHEQWTYIVCYRIRLCWITIRREPLFMKASRDLHRAPTSTSRWDRCREKPKSTFIVKCNYIRNWLQADFSATGRYLYFWQV